MDALMKTRRLAPVMAVALLVQLFGWAAPVVAATPGAVDDSFVVQKDSGSNSLDLLDNDTVTADMRITDVTQPTSGSVSITQAGLRVSYFVEAGFAGTVTFDYTLTD